MVQISRLGVLDRDDWLPLWRSYLDFYDESRGDAQTLLTFRRLVDPDFPVLGALARSDSGRPLGFVHWLVHPTTWADGPYCYLEDLFVGVGARAGGAGAALIEHVELWARSAGCSKVYWLTEESNATARRLYDRVANRSGFIQYEMEL